MKTAIILQKNMKNGYTVPKIIKPGCGHHPHGLVDPALLVEFAEKYY